MFGAAWAGETEVIEISVSTDSGETWAQAQFVDPVQRYGWRRWQFDWVTPKQPGQYTLLSRARDANGAMQPDKHDENYGSYVINHQLPIEITVGNP
jgi:Mo-co oxidoreductase dimerisation domain